MFAPTVNCEIDCGVPRVSFESTKSRVLSPSEAKIRARAAALLGRMCKILGDVVQLNRPAIFIASKHFGATRAWDLVKT